MFPAQNPKFKAYIAAAARQPEPWRTALVILIFLGLLLLIANFAPAIATYITTLLTSETSQTPPQLAVILTLAVFPLVLMAFALSLYLVHGRGVALLISPSRKILWRAFFIILFVVVLVSVLLAIPGFLRGDTRQQTRIVYWLIWAAPASILIFIQAFTEEVIFRGYLLQQFATHFKNKWIWWPGPAALFGLLHYNPETYGENAWLVVLIAILFGIILADITIRTGNLSYAIALHFANNFVLLLVFGTSGQLSSLSLFLRDIDLQNPEQARQAFLITLITMAAAYLIYILVIRKRR
ncbi:MAG: CPBP family intramembrane metalloprotease [Rhodobacteraceae bacterium]|nr:CPBP family intramembrane metalloprotease [Paracoccaceae bacterium]